MLNGKRKMEDGKELFASLARQPFGKLTTSFCSDKEDAIFKVRTSCLSFC